MAAQLPPESPPQDASDPKLYNAFFYGTLMAPKVLNRVCYGYNPSQNPRYATATITSAPAILHNFRRHRVKHADYPAILPASGATVRGLYVTGLTEDDIFRLDAFEGEEYGRYAVKVKVLKEVGNEGSGEGNVEGEEVEADTYVWEAGEGQLERREWDFEEFKREKMRFWTGEGGQQEFAEVDEAVTEAEANRPADGTGGRGVNGHITRALEEAQQKDGLRDAV